MTENSAEKVKGFILYSPFWDEEGKRGYFFRIYGKDGSFKDYDLRCEELEVTIESEFYSLYEDEKSSFIDFSSEALGVNKKE